MLKHLLTIEQLSAEQIDAILNKAEIYFLNPALVLAALLNWLQKN
jgi:hypothetical protein